MKIIYTFFLWAFACPLFGQHKITVVVDGIDNVQGQILVGVYNSTDTYMKTSVFQKMATVTADECTIVFDSIPNGEYAISLFHDDNSNGKLDTGLFGIPTEKYGFSNNAKGKMGPPTFEQTKFKLTSDYVMYITVN